MEEHKKLASIVSTFKKAAAIYKDNFRRIIPLNLIIIFLSLGASFIVSRSTYFGLKGLIVGLIISYSISLVLSGAARFGMAYSLAQKANPLQSYLWGLKNIISYLWVGLLITVIAIPGAMIFVIPGIIIVLYFVFTLFVMVDHGDRGLAVLIRSYFYVKDYFWGIAGRLFLGFSLFVLGGFIIALSNGTNAYLGLILREVYILFVIPFLTALNFSLYLNIKHLNPDIASARISSRYKNIFITIAIIGCAVIVSAIVLISRNYGLILENVNQIIQTSTY